MGTTVTEKDKAHFLNDMDRLAVRQAPPHIHGIRQSGTAAFLTMDYPHSRMETWRHTNVGPLLRIPWASLVEAPRAAVDESTVHTLLPPDEMPIRLVFTEGFFCPALSRTPELPGPAWVGSLASPTHGAAEAQLRAVLEASPPPKHVFDALNSAFLQDGPMILLPDNCTLDTPVHVVFVTGARPPRSAAHLRTVIGLGANASAHIVLHHVALAGVGEYFNNHVETMDLGAGASLERTEIIHEGAEGYRMALAHARLDRDSRLQSCVMTCDGGAITRNEINVRLRGPHAEAQLHGLYLNRRRGLIDNNLSIAHLAPHGVSRMRYKGILGDSSHSVFRGMVYVAQDAQKTDSQQLNANLALSDKARVDAKPQLEIYADDVRCTHGATVGGPPEDQVFYLRSRGLSVRAARALLTLGFARDAAEHIPDAATRRHMLRFLHARLTPGQRAIPEA